MLNSFLEKINNNPNAYALQKTLGAGYSAIRRPVTEQLFEQHLSGKITLGLYTTNPKDNACKWGVWDFDDDQEEDVNRLTRWLKSIGIHSLREAERPGRSGHVWLFVDRPISVISMHQLLAYGRFYNNFQSEIYPKQCELKPDQLGNLVRCPLGLHKKTNTVSYFSSCPIKDVDFQLGWFLSQQVNKAEDVLRLVKTLPTLAEPKPVKKAAGVKAEELPEWEWTITGSGEWVGPCPTCLKNGMDRSRNNLSYNPDKGLIYCFRNAGEHQFKQIMQDFKAIMV